MNFYEKCSEILGLEYQENGFKFSRRTRWNNRSPGNGRFKGYGLIRKFGNVYQIALQKPISYHGICYSEEEVFKVLKELMARRDVN
jgi:hypothetical protein